mgnify:CR=1 FL=1
MRTYSADHVFLGNDIEYSYFPGDYFDAYGEPHRALGRNTTQHIDAVQTENLIYRVMGLPYILDGTTHGNKSFINTHSKIPEFR